MWSDIFFWSMVGCAIIFAVRGVYYICVDHRSSLKGVQRDDQLEALLHAHHLKRGHYYLFVWDMRGISQARARDLSRMLSCRGIENGFMRARGTPPVVYDLKRPEQPVEEVTNE